MKKEIIHEEFSGKIIGAAMDVLNDLKPGLDEKLYERALVIELRRRGHTVDAQRSYPVFYNSELFGHLLPNLTSMTRSLLIRKWCQLLIKRTPPR